MSYFNQNRYSSSDSNNSSNSSSISDKETVEKGHKNVTKVDLGKFDDLCKKFKEKKDMKIKKLVGSDKEDFDTVVSYVHLLYETSYYPSLYEKVRKHFDNVTSVKPGTIGAYFAGCLVSLKDELNSNSNTRNDQSASAGSKAGCHISCAGSIPLPKDEEGWSFCDKAVILAEKGEKGYVFSMVKPAHSEEEMNPAYLFVDSKSLHEFRGFSKEEKDQIRALGCKKVKMVGYNSSSSDVTYSDLYREPKAVHEIKHRHDRSVSSETNLSNDYSLIGGILIVIVILIILLLLVGYKYMNRR
jgi:hypothetical protein